MTAGSASMASKQNSLPGLAVNIRSRLPWSSIAVTTAAISNSEERQDVDSGIVDGAREQDEGAVAIGSGEGPVVMLLGAVDTSEELLLLQNNPIMIGGDLVDDLHGNQDLQWSRSQEKQQNQNMYCSLQ